MNPVRNVSATFFTAAALIAAVAWNPAAHAQASAATPEAKPAATGLSDPFEVKGENWRGKPFYEILFMNREANGSGIGNYFNSLGNTFNIPAEAVDAKFRALNAEALAKEYGSDGVFFNGPRRYVANGFTAIAYNGGQKRVMGTIPFFVYGTFEAPVLTDSFLVRRWPIRFWSPNGRIPSFSMPASWCMS